MILERIHLTDCPIEIDGNLADKNIWWLFNKDFKDRIDALLEELNANDAEPSETVSNDLLSEKRKIELMEQKIPDKIGHMDNLQPGRVASPVLSMACSTECPTTNYLSPADYSRNIVRQWMTMTRSNYPVIILPEV